MKATIVLASLTVAASASPLRSHKKAHSSTDNYDGKHCDTNKFLYACSDVDPAQMYTCGPAGYQATWKKMPRCTGGTVCKIDGTYAGCVKGGGDGGYSYKQPTTTTDDSYGYYEPTTTEDYGYYQPTTTDDSYGYYQPTTTEDYGYYQPTTTKDSYGYKPTTPSYYQAPPTTKDYRYQQPTTAPSYAYKSSNKRPDGAEKSMDELCYDFGAYRCQGAKVQQCSYVEGPKLAWRTLDTCNAGLCGPLDNGTLGCPQEKAKWSHKKSSGKKESHGDGVQNWGQCGGKKADHGAGKTFGPYKCADSGFHCSFQPDGWYAQCIPNGQNL